MRQLYRHLSFTLFLVVLGALAVQVSCVEVGPVPDFEYSYDFEGDLTDIDVTAITAGTVAITPGSVTERMTAFRDALASPAQASAYAAAIDAVLDAGQESYWLGQTQTGIASGLENGDATLSSQLGAATTDFQGNGTIQNLIPAIVNATGSSSRTSSSGRTAAVNASSGIQQQTPEEEELEDCRQAAQDAFEVAIAIVDALRSDQLAAIDARYADQFPLVEAQRAALESAADTRHQARVAIYLTLYNEIATNISNLFTAGDITAAERDLLTIGLNVVYAFHYNASLTLLNSELTLINNLLAQAETNLTASRDSLINQVNTNYNNEFNRLTTLRNTTQAFCHNQGGVNTN